MSEQSRPGEELGNKLSVKSFGWDKGTILEAVMANKDEPIFLARFMGAASGLRKYKVPANQVKDGVDEGFGLSGQFVGVNSDGEQVKGSVLYLPRYVHDMVEAALTMSGDVEAVRIGFDIYAQFDEDSATSYVFTARDLLNTGSTVVTEVFNKVMALGMPGALKALPKGK